MLELFDEYHKLANVYQFRDVRVYVQLFTVDHILVYIGRGHDVYRDLLQIMICFDFF